MVVFWARDDGFSWLLGDALERGLISGVFLLWNVALTLLLFFTIACYCLLHR